MNSYQPRSSPATRQWHGAEYIDQVPRSYWIETLGCPKNQVDSDKLAAALRAAGWKRAAGAAKADLVVVNTCAFIEPAREESIRTILDLTDMRGPQARLVVTGCMAKRYPTELAEALPEVDDISPTEDLLLSIGDDQGGQAPPLEPSPKQSTQFLLDFPRRRTRRPWAYLKVAEGCDRRCGFCAIPSFRGSQVSRSLSSVIAEAESLRVKEVVLVAQDLVSYGKDRTRGPEGGRTEGLGDLLRHLAQVVPWVRLLYLYPSGLNKRLVDQIATHALHYFDLSLQHASGSLLRRMRRFGSAERFLELISYIRLVAPDAALRSSFIVGYPGETEQDHEELLAFLEEARLDWAGFFAYSPEEGTYAAQLPGRLSSSEVADRMGEASSLQADITAAKRLELVGTRTTVLVEAPGQGRSHREAPEIDGVVLLPDEPKVGEFVEVEITSASGVDLEAIPAQRRQQATLQGDSEAVA
jgi:ribosomal protein S12 methylthiotransferase